MAKNGQVTIEFFGIPRQRAGRAELVVPAGTVAEVLQAVTRACPGLEGLLTPAGQLAPHYRVSLNGQRFVQELRDSLVPGERLLILSADAGR